MRPVLTHVAMQCRDIDATIDFYRRYCGLHAVHRREQGRITWLAEPGREQELILVLMGGGDPRAQDSRDYGHLGFAVAQRDEVDAIAKRARDEGCLVWPPRDEPFPVGYYCGVRDPDGRFVEFSYGQPLGPGAPPLPDETPS